jgi:hypothetical protein
MSSQEPSRPQLRLATRFAHRRQEQGACRCVSGQSSRFRALPSRRFRRARSMVPAGQARAAHGPRALRRSRRSPRHPTPACKAPRLRRPRPRHTPSPCAARAWPAPPTLCRARSCLRSALALTPPLLACWRTHHSDPLRGSVHGTPRMRLRHRRLSGLRRIPPHPPAQLPLCPQPTASSLHLRSRASTRSAGRARRAGRIPRAANPRLPVPPPSPRRGPTNPRIPRRPPCQPRRPHPPSR